RGSAAGAGAGSGGAGSGASCSARARAAKSSSASTPWSRSPSRSRSVPAAFATRRTSQTQSPRKTRPARPRSRIQLTRPPAPHLPPHLLEHHQAVAAVGEKVGQRHREASWRTAGVAAGAVAALRLAQRLAALVHDLGDERSGRSVFDVLGRDLLAVDGVAQPRDAQR